MDKERYAIQVVKTVPPRVSSSFAHAAPSEIGPLIKLYVKVRDA
ncbi:hypothetical protein [Pseudomonas sichuanensis]|nr:hypothetical protein [Pseudomonas sichuanensis]